MSALLGCHDLTKAYQGRTLFEDLTLAIEEGERIGLIGPNGAGKSTLLRILAGLDEADAGERVLSRGVRLAVVDQTDDFEPGSTPEQVVLAALTDEPDEVARITRAQIVLSKVGFEATDQPVSTLSGGWRKRLSLARALVVEPDLVLLDEPTNHLDLRGIAWLEKLLGNASFAWLMISHDRYMLERVANRVVEIGRHYPGGHLRVEGSYSTFLLKREELLAAQRSREASLKNTVRREVEWLRRGPRGRGTKAKGRIKAAGAAMEELADVQERNAARTLDSFAFSGTGRRSRELLRVTDLILERGGKRLCSGLELSLGPGDRIGVLGDNGCGKSTLLGTLAGELEPAAGAIKLAKDLRVVTFHQDRSRLDPEATLRETLVNEGDTVDYRGQRMHVKSWAKRFLFEPDRLEIRVKALSGGEQARLLIAELIRQPADLLILDEPTNDLDLATREVLEESLESFPGAVILVTHDRYLLEQVCTGLLGFDGQGNVHPLADLIQWERLLARLAKQEKEARAKERAKTKPAAPRRERRLSSKERRELEGIEAAIEAAEALADVLEKKTQEPEIATDHVALIAACDELSAAQKQVEHLYARWELLEAKKAGEA